MQDGTDISSANVGEPNTFHTDSNLRLNPVIGRAGVAAALANLKAAWRGRSSLDTEKWARPCSPISASARGMWLLTCSFPGIQREFH